MEDLQVGDIFRYQTKNDLFYWDWEIVQCTAGFFTLLSYGTNHDEFQDQVGYRTVVISTEAIKVHIRNERIKVISRASQKIEIET